MEINSNGCFPGGWISWLDEDVCFLSQIFRKEKTDHAVVSCYILYLRELSFSGTSFCAIFHILEGSFQFVSIY